MDGLLSIAEAALRLGRSYQVTWNLALKGRLGPVQRFNRNYVLTTSGVEAFAKQSAEAATPAGSAV